MTNQKRTVSLTALLLFAFALNLYYHWDWFWTLWAKQYLKGQDIVISMTTTPHRIHELDFPLRCLANQNIPVRTIYISIPHVFKRDNLEYHIPGWLEAFPNITVLRTEDFGPATKILGAVKHGELRDDTIIIAVDDDTCYPENLVARLAVRAKQNPDMVVGVSGGVINTTDKHQCGVTKVKRDKATVPIIEGFAGVAYRAKFFDPTIYNVVNEPSYCYNSDDLYISFHLAAKNVRCQTVNNKFIKINDMIQQEFGYNRDALYKIDVSEAVRYKKCLDYLQSKHPEVKFNANGIG